MSVTWISEVRCLRFRFGRRLVGQASLTGASQLLSLVHLQRRAPDLLALLYPGTYTRRFIGNRLSLLGRWMSQVELGSHGNGSPRSNQRGRVNDMLDELSPLRRNALTGWAFARG